MTSRMSEVLAFIRQTPGATAPEIGRALGIGTDKARDAADALYARYRYVKRVPSPFKGSPARYYHEWMETPA
ncbi:MAG: hypothetical protein AB7E70_20295 [Hyphomicrobiaceae bacterium]